MSQENVPISCPELVQALTLSAQSASRSESAAVWLLVFHESWIQRLAEVAAGDEVAQSWAGLQECVVVQRDEDGVWWARIRWAELAAFAEKYTFPYSRTEVALLNVACSIASNVPVHLGDAVAGLDRVNTAAVMYAIAQASGHGEHYVDLISDAATVHVLASSMNAPPFFPADARSADSKD